MAIWLCGYVAVWPSSKISKLSKFQKPQKVAAAMFQHFPKNDSQISKNDIFHDVPIFVLVFVEAFCYSEMNKYGFYGVKNPEIMEL